MNKNRSIRLILLIAVYIILFIAGLLVSSTREKSVSLKKSLTNISAILNIYWLSYIPKVTE